MRVPKQRVRFTKSYEGSPSANGYLVIDLKGLDIEGVNSLVMDMSEVDAARNAGDQQEDAKHRARELLGGL
jgi:hypothetical protein